MIRPEGAEFQLNQNQTWHLLCKNSCGYSPEIYTVFGPEVHADRKELTFRPNQPIMLYDIFCMQRRLVASYDSLQRPCKALFSKNGDKLFILSDGYLLVIDTQTGDQITNIETPSRIVDFCLSNNGQQIALVCSIEKVLILNAQNFSKIKSLQIPDAEITSIKFNRNDSQLLLTFLCQKFVQVWGMDENLIFIGNHDDNINYATFSDDNSMILTASNDKTVKIWNAQNGQLISTLQHDSPVYHTYMDRSGQIMTKDARDQSWIWIIAREVLKYPKRHPSSSKCTIL